MAARQYGSLKLGSRSLSSDWVTSGPTIKEAVEIDLSRLPEGRRGFAKSTPVWTEIAERVQAGELVSPGEVYKAAGPQLPDWAGDARNNGSQPRLAPAHRREVRIFEPRPLHHVLRRQVAGGQAHISKGMNRGLVVSGDSTGDAEPEADLNVRVGGKRPFRPFPPSSSA